ncbi:MAG: hypothetical protein DHS20C08_18730 [Rhodomicrobium sp.]|nr:MAG: hypothetical protein DHS20C08_18730 [Rhodomicrobium sp.]
MIICSCNRISDKQIRAVVTELLEEDPNALLTPGLIYKKLGFRAECGTCLTLAIETIINEIDHPSHNGCQVIHLSRLQEKIRNKKKNATSQRAVNKQTRQGLRSW